MENNNLKAAEPTQTEQLNLIIGCLADINETLKGINGAGANKSKPEPETIKIDEYNKNWFIPCEYLTMKAKTHLTETENAILTILECETFGKDLKQCVYSVPMFVKALKRDSHNIRRSILKLKNRNIIKRVGYTENMTTIWSINTDFTMWDNSEEEPGADE